MKITLSFLKSIAKKYLLFILCGGGGILFLLFLFFAPKDTPKQEEALKHQERLYKPKVASVEEAVDPRNLWAESLNEEMKALRTSFEERFDKERLKNEEGKKDLESHIAILQSRLQVQEQKETNVRLIDKTPQIQKKGKNFVYLKVTPQNKVIKSLKSYVPAGAFARAVLLTGIAADTGTEAASAPQPILLRLVDQGIFSNKEIKKPLKHAILIGSCHGNISSERAVCRLQTLSLKDEEGHIFEKQVEGWVIGEDGREGLKGIVVDKTTDMTRMAVLNGILGGIASFFQNQATSSVYPVSPISGQKNALRGMEALKAGGASGVGNALQKLADYAIKRAEQLSPVIVVGSGRDVDVVFKQGFSLIEEDKDNSLTPHEDNTLQHIPLKEGEQKAAQKRRQRQDVNQGLNQELNGAQKLVSDLSMGDF